MVGSTADNTPPHLPTAPGTSFQRPPANKGTVQQGSPTVKINGKPAARHGDKALTCNDPADLAGGHDRRRRHRDDRLTHDEHRLPRPGLEFPGRPGRRRPDRAGAGRRTRASASRSGRSWPPRPGERVMRPDFGCGLHDLVFGVNNAATATAVTSDGPRGARHLGAAHRRARRVRRTGPGASQCPASSRSTTRCARPTAGSTWSTRSTWSSACRRLPIDKRELPATSSPQTGQLAGQFSGWRPAPDGQPDAGQALIQHLRPLRRSW